MTSVAMTEPVSTEADPIESPSLEPRRGCGAGEILLFLAGSAAFLIGLVLVSDSRILFTRRFWFDEVLTSLIVRDPSVMHAVAAVKGGVDTNPPVYHLLLRGFYTIVGGPPEVTFRLFSGLCMWGALLATYAALRRSFAVVPALLAILVLSANPLLIKQSSEARFYAPLALGAACFAFLFCADGSGWSPRRRRIHAVLLAAAAVLTCTVHYFGGIAVVAVVIGDFLARSGPERRRRLRLLLPVAAGPIALVAMYPFIHGQRQGMEVPTWIDDTSFDLINHYFDTALDLRAVGIVLLGWLASHAWSRRRTTEGSVETAAASASVTAVPNLIPVAGLGALFIVPFVILAFSLLVQPSLVSKYAIAGTLSLAPIAALLATTMRGGARIVVAVLVLTLGFFQIRELSRVERVRDRNLGNRAKSWKNTPDKRPIVFVTRSPAYMMQYVQPVLASRIILVNLRGTGVEPPSRYHAYELQMAEKVYKFYPSPPLVSPEELRHGRPFYFGSTPEELTWLRSVLPLRQTESGQWRAMPAATTTAAPATAPATAPAR